MYISQCSHFSEGLEARPKVSTTSDTESGAGRALTSVTEALEEEEEEEPVNIYRLFHKILHFLLDL